MSPVKLAVNLLFSCINFFLFPLVPLPLSSSLSCLETLVFFLKRIISIVNFVNFISMIYGLSDALKRSHTAAWRTNELLDSESHSCPSLSLDTKG